MTVGNNVLPVTSCALCGKATPLVQSHIIPESCYQQMYDEKHRLIVLEGGLHKRAKRPPQKGIREPLLCANCDAVRLGPLDKYFAEEWIQKNRLSGWTFPGTPVRPITGLDYAQFKLFHLSVLFRAHISKRQEFSGVRLRPEFEHKLRELLMAGTQPTAVKPVSDLFIPLVAYAYLDERGKGIIASPCRIIRDDIRMYSFYYGNCEWIFIEMDASIALPKRPPQWLQTFLNIRLRADGRIAVHIDNLLEADPIKAILGLR